jgi:hypothetical protein
MPESNPIALKVSPSVQKAADDLIEDLKKLREAQARYADQIQTTQRLLRGMQPLMTGTTKQRIGQALNPKRSKKKPSSSDEKKPSSS